MKKFFGLIVVLTAILCFAVLPVQAGSSYIYGGASQYMGAYVNGHAHTNQSIQTNGQMNFGGVEADFSMYGYSSQNVGHHGSASTYTGSYVDLSVVGHHHSNTVMTGVNAYSGASSHGNASADSNAGSYISVQN